MVVTTPGVSLHPGSIFFIMKQVYYDIKAKDRNTNIEYDVEFALSDADVENIKKFYPLFKENDLDCVKFHHWGPVMRFKPKGYHEEGDYEVINYDYSVIVMYRDMFVLEIYDASYDEPYVGVAQTEDIFFHDNDEEESKE